MDRMLSHLSAYTSRLSYADLPREVVHAVKRVVIDSLGCAMGAYGSEPARIARRLAHAARVPHGVTVMGSGDKTTPELAAFANGVMVRYLDYNDTFTAAGGAGHPSDYVPAVLAAAELAGADGRRVITGIVLAYEMFCRMIDAAALGMERWDHVTIGVLASAAAAASAAGLTESQIANAISLAVVPNVALQETRFGDLSMWKGCAAPNACRNGVFAVLLAAEGMSGPPAPYEGRAGFWKAVSGRFDPPVLGGPDRPFAITESHLKLYPAGFFSQTAVDAAREVRSKLVAVDDISDVEIETFPFGCQVMAGDEEKWHPTTRESADHSLPYVVSVALLYGDLKVQHFDDQCLHDPKLLALLRKVKVRESAECTAAWPEAAMSRINVTTNGGARSSAAVKYHRGHAKNPMSDAEVAAKFLSQAREVLPARQAQALLEAAWRLDDLGHVADLLRLTRSRGGG